MSDLKLKLAELTGPGALAGITLGDWLALLWENRFRVHPRFWGRVGFISVSAPFTSVIAPLERWRYAGMYRQTAIPSPLFLLGGWRCGTTHLHNLFALDERFGYSSLFQTMYPRTFLTSEWWWLPLLAAMTPRKRWQDNVSLSLKEPAQDEMALCIMTRRSSMLGWVFPQRFMEYERFLDFQEVADTDIDVWKRGFREFLHKLTYVNSGRPSVLKSPYHTARIRLLMETFPDARFLHIHRHPYEVFPSLCHTMKKVMGAFGVQTLDESQLEDDAIETYRRLYRAYFEQVGEIPAGRFHDISYQQLSERPLETLIGAYESLGLPDFDVVRPTIEKYLSEVSSYERN
ncbi:MAG: sulfotransferase family protein, partial [Planctomycetaceae bacterium]